PPSPDLHPFPTRRSSDLAETQVAQAELNLTRSRGELEKARGQLAAAVGLAVNNVLKVQTLADLPPVKQISESLEELLERFGDLRSEEHTSELQSLAYLVC